MSENCETCRFFHQDEHWTVQGTKLEGHPPGECRRRSPTLLYDRGESTGSEWPRCGARDWCGEWEESERREVSRGD